MKKKVLFVIPSLDAGGAEKSLVNLLNTFDYSKYSVDLVLFHQQGTFLPLLPKEVTLLQLNSNYTIFTNDLAGSVMVFLKKLRFDLASHRVLFFLKNRFMKNKAYAEQKSWKNKSASINTLPNEYDAAIGYLEKSSLYFVVDKVKANQKIGWIHTNYSNSGMQADFDLHYFKKLQALIAVSPDCATDLQINFPLIVPKIKVINNIVSAQTLNRLAAEYKVDVDKNTLLTLARLSPEKGCDLALEAAKILKDKNINFQWLIIGEGNQREQLEAKIREYHLEDVFLLKGVHQNPYPYLLAAQIYVQPSRYEGKSMAIEEAKIFKKPIIVTNYPTVNDQIEANVTGIIAAINPEALAQSIADLLNNRGMQEQLTTNLAAMSFSNEYEITYLYNLIDGK